VDELIQQIVNIVRGMWQRRWIGLAVAWVVGLVAAVVVWRIPDRYEATARVYVDTQSVLKPLMSGLTVQPDIDQQVAMLARTLITRPNVEKLMRNADLDLSLQTQRDRDAMVDFLTKEIKVAGGGRENLYAISFRDVSPDRARRVVQSLVSLFVESGLGDKKRDTEAARRFIDEQIKVYEKKLEESENRLKEFKLKHLGFTEGGAGQDYFAKMTQLTEEVNKVRLELRVAEQSRDALKRELAGEEPTLSSDLTASIPVAANPELDARLDSLRRQLDEHLRRYTDEHPDVVITKRMIAQLEEQKRQELEAKKRQAAAKGTGRGAATNPVFQQLRVSLAESEANVAALRARFGELQARLSQQRASAGRVPQVEAELAQLNRDYEIIRRNYEQLAARRESASISEDVDTSASLADFRVIDPPRVSPRPVFPNRAALIPLGLLLALGGGLAVCFAISQAFPTVHTVKSLRSLAGRPVLGSVSLVVSAVAQKRERQAGLVFGGGVALLVLAYGTWTVLAAVQVFRA
jgi:polysaccharide chain length determinant protein (PEP-CTERM system associated)